jgi:tetratricopeptide (TPR) repeat protein
LLPSYSSDYGDSVYEDATRIANQGVQADPSISEAAAALRGYIHNKRGEWMEADLAYQTALRAGHVESTTHQWYSNMLASVGRLQEALEQAHRARRLDPLSPVVMSRLAMTSLWTNDHEAAGRQFAVADELGIKSQVHLESQLLLLIREGRHDEVRLRARDPESGTAPEWLLALLDCLSAGNRCDAAAASLQSNEAASARVQLVAWALLGRLDKVGEIAARLEQDIGAFETELLFIAELEDFRQLPQFQRLLDAIGISDYWEQIGCRWSETGVRCDG